MTATTETTDTTTIETGAAEEFADRMFAIFNDSALGLLLSVGHQTGLFETMAGRAPATSAGIAAAAGLQERYVREWLGGATAGRVVEYDPATATYWLPAEHAASLTSAAGSQNMARMMQFIPLLASVEGKVVKCFREGGGVGYESFERFHALMAEDSAATHDAGLLDLVVPKVPGLAERLTTGIDVADIGCGSGHAINILARRFPRSRYVGYDFSQEAIAAARAESTAWGLTNTHFVLLDVTLLDAAASYDLVTAFDAIHDQAHPAQVLTNIAEALRPGGTFLMVDIQASSRLEDNIDVPWSAFLYAASLMHCMTVSLALGGDGLGTVWGNQTASRMLHEAGFDHVDIKQAETDPFNAYYVATRD
jgi:SAM-dependent methyltransferase